MAKIQITENKLKQIIRECVENVINEESTFPNYYEMYKQQENNPANQTLDGTNVTMTRKQADERNAEVNNALSSWNKLGTVGQIREIQKLVGATPDGKLGPQTLGKIYIALTKNNPLQHASFRSGKQGTYNNI